MKRINLKFSIITLLTFNVILSQQLLDATLLEVNFSDDSYPRSLTKTANKIYFSADDGYKGRELWVYDGITNETRFVKDVYEGNNSSISYNNFITIGENLFFTSNDGINGDELWFSNGTEEGTFLLKDINTGFSSSNIRNLYTQNNILFFIANDGVNGEELWRSDGTEIGTFLIKDINFGNQNSEISNFYTFNNLLFFSANNGTNGKELWCSDGTTSGTNLLKDINLGNQNSSPINFFEFNNYLYFVANNGIDGFELWKSDGTENGTNLFINLRQGMASGLNYFNNNFLIFNNNFYFYANNGIDGNEIWRSDGTISGTYLLKDIYLGSNSSANNLIGIVSNGYFIFSALTNSSGIELWLSDGSPTGTYLLKDIFAGFQSSLINPEFININNIIYFKADNGINGEELWKTDGTTHGTELLKDIFPGQNLSGINNITTFNNNLIFSAKNDNTYNKLWRSDGSNSGTFEIKDINLNQSSNTVLKFLEFNGNIFFAGGRDDLNGNELWKTDGTSENTNIVYDISKKSGVITSEQSDFTKFNDKIIFAGTNGLSGVEPFITDGTMAGTKIIKDILPGISSSIWNFQDNRPFFTKAGNYVFFKASNGSGFEIFRTDGTEEGTFMVKDIASGNTSSIDDFPTFFGHNDIFYFKANDQVHGQELWRSDGTTEGTFMLKDIFPGVLSGIYFSNFYDNHYNADNRKCFAPIGQYLYFMAKDDQGNGLWRTDGSTDGTTKILAIPSSGGLDNPIIIGSNGNNIFYITNINNSTYGNNSLWVTDGTQSNTLLLGEYLMSGNQQFKKSTNLGSFFYYTVNNINGSNLMKTDGTLAGTSQVTSFYFPFFEKFNFLEKCGDYIYFIVNHYGSPSGKELWRTNGILGNTILIEGYEYENPNFIANCTCINDNLFYTKDFYPHSVFYIKNDNIIPNQIQINNVNAPNFQQYEGIYSPQSLLNLNNNIMFGGYTFSSGSELYFSELGNLLSDDNFNLDTKQDEVTIYPNPSTGIFNIKLNSYDKLEKIEVFDFNGKKILSNIVKDTFINCSNLDKGIYLIKVYTNNNIHFQRIIKK